MTSQQYLQLQFDTLLKYSTHGIWIMDGDGVVLHVNPAAERLIGVTAQDVIGKNIVHLAEKDVIDQALTPHVLKARHPVTKLLYVLKTEKYIMSSGIPVFDEAGNIILVVVSEYDMTTLNSLQVQLEELRDVADKYKDELAHIKLMDFKKYGIISESQEMEENYEYPMSDFN